ncbi:MAG TPA: c-type cytochrome [Candidatus Binatia bacterium]
MSGAGPEAERRLRLFFYSGGGPRTQSLVALIVVAALVLSAAPAGAATLQDLLTVCLGCHGAKGQSAIPEVPSLGGQPAFYLTIQLMMFRERLRAVEPMNQMLRGLGDDDLRAMADHIAKLPPPEPAAGPVDPARVERARALIEQNRCNFCHNRNYSGAENVPRLAGQREDYLAKALSEYKNNTRRGYDASMADVLYPVSDEQLTDLAYFLARQR